MNHGITVIEYPISLFEEIELAGSDEPREHVPTVEEYKATLPDYNPGPVGTVKHPEDYLWDSKRNRLIVRGERARVQRGPITREGRDAWIAGGGR